MRTIISFLLTIFFGNTMFAQWNATPDLPFNPAIKTGLLENGMTYAIQKNSYPEKKAHVSLYVKIGSAWEEIDEQGIAHFIEHLAFNGSKNFSKNDVVKYLESIGLTFGGDLNAETGFTHTHYKLEVPTQRTGALDSSLMILADFAYYMTIDPEDVKNEKSIIQNERSLRSSAEYKKLYFLAKEITKPSVLGIRLPIGDSKVIDTISAKALRKFYEKWYVPENFMVAVVGDVDENKTLDLIKKYFDVDTRNHKVPTKNEIIIEPFKGQDLITFEHPDLSAQNVEIYFSPQKTIPLLTKENYKNRFLQGIAIQVLNNRISETLKLNPGSMISGGLTPVNIGTPYYNMVLSIQMEESKTKEAINDLFNIVGPWYAYGITEDELKQQISIFQSRFKSFSANMHRIPSSYYLYNIIEWYSTSAIPVDLLNMFELENELYKNITVKDVNDKLKEFDFTHFKVLVSNKQVDKVKLAGLPELISQNFKKSYAVQEAVQIPTTLLEKHLKPGKIIKETVLPEDSSIKKWELSNGLTVYAQHTAFIKNHLNFLAYRKGGFHGVPKEKVLDAMFSQSIVDLMGYGAFSPVSLKKYLSGKEANISVSLNDQYQLISGEAQSSEMKTLFELLQLKTLYPKIDNDLFNNGISRFSDALKNVMNDPMNLLKDSVHKLKHENNIYAGVVYPSQAMLKNLNSQKSYEYYKEVFQSLEGFTFFFIGNYQEDSLKNYIEKYIASLPVSDRKHSYTALKGEPIPVNQTLRMNSGSSEGTFYAGEFFGKGKFDLQSVNIATILSSVITQRINEVIREEKQYIYAGGANLNIKLYPEPRFVLRYELPTKSEYIDSLGVVFNKILDQLIKDGPTDQELNIAKSQVLNNLETQLKENSFWLYRMFNFGIHQQSLKDPETIKREYESISKEQVQSLLQYVLENSNHFIEISEPSKK